MIIIIICRGKRERERESVCVCERERERGGERERATKYKIGIMVLGTWYDVEIDDMCIQGVTGGTDQTSGWCSLC